MDTWRDEKFKYIRAASIRTTLLVGLLGLSLGSIALALAPDPGWANVARVVQGLSASLIGPTASTFAIRLSPPTQTGRALSIVFSGTTIAMVAGVPLASWIGESWPWSWVYLFIAATALFLAGVSGFLLPEDRNEGRITNPLDGIIRTVANPAVNLALWTTLLRIAAQFGCYTLIGVLIVDRFGMPSSAVHGLLLAYGLAGVLSSLVAGILVDRLGTVRMLRLSAWALVASYMGLVILTPASKAAFVWLVISAWGLLGLLSFAPHQKYLAEQGHPSIPSVALSLNAAALYAGMALGSAIAGALASQLDIQVLAWLSLLLASTSVITAELSFRFSRRKRRGL